MDSWKTSGDEFSMQKKEQRLNKISASEHNLLRQKQENLEAALIQKHMEEELIEEELRSLPTTVQQQHPDIRSGTRYVQHVSLPNNGRPDENAYMYSSVMPDVRINLIILNPCS